MIKELEARVNKNKEKILNIIDIFEVHAPEDKEIIAYWKEQLEKEEKRLIEVKELEEKVKKVKDNPLSGLLSNMFPVPGNNPNIKMLGPFSFNPLEGLIDGDVNDNNKDGEDDENAGNDKT